MKLNSSKNVVAAGLVIISAFLSFACQKQSAEKSATPAETVKAETPTEAYGMLYAAVKAKDKDKIRQLVSKSSMGLAEFSAAQQKIDVDKFLENGITATTFSPTLPQIRDERIKDNFGALEVYNSKDNHWEDLPFVLEDGGWKLAVGDIFQNTYKSPGKGQAELEREASGNNMMMTPNSNSANINKMNQPPLVNKPKK
ncbi:MAG: hypothetical protein ABI686_15240 [Acidobacteriota bacterium]